MLQTCPDKYSLYLSTVKAQKRISVDQYRALTMMLIVIALGLFFTGPLNRHLGI